MSSPSGAESLPVISMRRLESGRTAGAMAVAREIRAACETVGFFYVRDHGVPLETIETARSACLEFYRRPLEEKLRAGVNEMHRGFVPMGQTVLSDGALTDHKESFTMGLDLPRDDPDVVAGRPLMGPNVFPDDMPHMRDAMVACRDAVAACAARLLRAIALALSLPTDFFEAMYDKPLVRLSANYYPPLPPDAPSNQFGTSPHTDYGVITLLWQDDRGGLELRHRSGSWHPATPKPGTFVVNIGDLLARWTNDRFVSTAHRVRNLSGLERLSLACFYDPHPDTVVECIESCREPGTAPRYPVTTCGEYIRSRFDAVFAYRKSGHTGDRPRRA